MPAAPATVRGLFNVRGQIVPLLDTGELLGLGSPTDSPFAVVVRSAGEAAVAWLQLGLALGAVEDRRGASRAYAAALAALDRCDREAVQAGLDGWPADELAGVLRAKLGRP